MVIKDINSPLLSYDGKPIKISNEPNSENVNFKSVAILALMDAEKSTGIDGIEKARRYSLAVDIYKSEDVIDLSISDINLIKELIGKIFPPLLVGPAYAVIDKSE